MKKSFLVILVLLLVGCQSAYEEPPDELTIKIRKACARQFYDLPIPAGMGGVELYATDLQHRECEVFMRILMSIYEKNKENSLK